MLDHLGRPLALALLAGTFATAALRAQECFSPPEWARADLPWSGNAAGSRIEEGLASQARGGLVDVLLDLDGCATPADLERFGRFGEIGFVGRFLSVVQLRRVPVAAVAALAADPRVARVEADHAVTVEVNTSVRALRVRASQLYSPNTVEDRHPEITGRGVNIAILDTGVDDGRHASLPAAKFVGGFNALTNREGNPDDAHGHGTHVAGIALGIGRSPAGDFRGVALGAGLVDIKVTGLLGGSDSTVIRGIEKCIERRVAWNIGVMNLSLGSESGRRSDGTDALSQAVNRAVRAGIVAIVAGGNSAGQGVMAPAAADEAVTVAAADDLGTVRRNDDVIAPFSTRGPRLRDRDADRADELKPDVAAPGVEILAARHDSPGAYGMKTGTSFAAAHVSGLAALVLQANPGMRPAQVKERILGTAQDFGAPGWDPLWGYGLVNGRTAVP
jgi:serine protease AprX